MKTRSKRWIIIIIAVLLAVLSIATEEYLVYLFLVPVVSVPLAYLGTKKTGIMGDAFIIGTIFIATIAVMVLDKLLKCL